MLRLFLFQRFMAQEPLKVTDVIVLMYICRINNGYGSICYFKKQLFSGRIFRSGSSSLIMEYEGKDDHSNLSMRYGGS